MQETDSKGAVQPPTMVDLWVRCRRCPPCLRMRANLWMARACQEVREASRTWFCTWTLRPEEHYRMLARSGAEPGKEFSGIHSECSKEFTRYLKRVRKEAGARFRYLIVCEAHKSGLPHYHGLIHERGEEVRWSTLSDQWHLGFGKYKLVREDERGHAGRYVCKYLSKSVLARVRASQRYGDGTLPEQYSVLTIAEKA